MNLQIFWFCLIAFLWSGYFLLEGFDFGVGMLLPFVPRDEGERGAMFQSIGPTWDGNETWLVVAAGATFAAFPAWYAAMFSGFYLALLLILFFLIVRVLSFEWRGKSESRRWRRTWMWANAAGSAGIALIWGIALANLIHGLPLDSNGDYTGDLADLFTVYTVFAGLTFVIVFAFHGASFLTLRTTGDLGTRAQRAARTLALPAVAAGAAFLIWTVVVATDRNDKDVFPPVAAGCDRHRGARTRRHPRLPGSERARVHDDGRRRRQHRRNPLHEPVPASHGLDPDFGNSLTVSNAASAHYTLAVLTVIAVIVTPIVVLYQAWTLLRLPRPGHRRRGAVADRRHREACGHFG